MTTQDPNMQPAPPQQPAQYAPNPYLQQPAPRKSSNSLVVGLLASGLVIVIVALALSLIRPAGLFPTGTVACAESGGTAFEVSVNVNVVSVVLPGAQPKATLDIYSDYMCPYCGQFERANQLDLERLLEAGKIKVNYHLMSFLDSTSEGTKYSTRAASDALEVAKNAPGSFLAFHNGLFDNQPSEGTTGVPDEDLAWLAQRLGVPASVTAAFSTMGNEPAITQGTQADFNDIDGTPAVMLNGTQLEQTSEKNFMTKGTLKQVIEEAIR
ncbi:MAG: thioredoxin domain-containing protein [Propionibacteriaceae bacterium]|jgi:protein-disulfide isomerase|nr:thioredoxin domain-containing protein [Propionibacteriaceae bacterium]